MLLGVFFVKAGKWTLHVETESRVFANQESAYLRDMLGLKVQIFERKAS